jgi:hypothetical protein
MKYIYIGSVPQCMFPRRNRDSPTLSPASECDPPPTRNPREVGWAHSPVVRGGVRIPTTGEKPSTLSSLLFCT